MEKKQVYISVYTRDVYFKADQYEINGEAGVVTFHRVSKIYHDDGDTGDYDWKDNSEWGVVKLANCFIGEDWEAVVRHTTERCKKENSIREAKKKEWLKRFNDLVEESKGVDFCKKDFEDMDIYRLPYELRWKIVREISDVEYYRSIYNIVKSRCITLPIHDDYKKDNVPSESVHISHIVAVSKYRRGGTDYIRYEFNCTKCLELHATKEHQRELECLKEAWAILGV